MAALTFYIDNGTGQAYLDLIGRAAGGDSGDPVTVPRATIDCAWQWYNVIDGQKVPARKPVSTAIDFGFALVNANGIPQFEGDWVCSIDQSTLARATSGTGVGYKVNISPSYAAGNTGIEIDGGSGTILANDSVHIGNFDYRVVSYTGTTLTIPSPGLLEIIPDNQPVTINTEYGFYTAQIPGDTAAMRALLNTPNGDPADDLDAKPLAGMLLWTLPTAGMGDPPQSTNIIYGNARNTFTMGGSSLPATNGTFTPISSNTTANGKQSYLVDLTSGAFTLTLPLTPSVGTAVPIWDGFSQASTHNLTVARNGQLIDSSASNATLSTNGFYVIYGFVGSTIGWKSLTLAP